MSLKLDELRKRLLQQPPPELAALERHHPTIVAAVDPAVVCVAKTAEPSASISEAESAKALVATAQKSPITDERKPANSASPATELPPSGASHPEPAISHPIIAEPLSASEVAPPESQIAEAVARVFEETATVQLRFDALTGTFAELGRIGAAAEEAIEPLRAFHARLAELAEAFGPMRALQAQLGRMAETFEPMKALHDQISRLADSIQNHLAELVNTLEPALVFRGRILSLARSFDGAGALRDSLDELCSASRGDIHTQFRSE